jgi:hypothetical protein
MRFDKKCVLDYGIKFSVLTSAIYLVISYIYHPIINWVIDVAFISVALITINYFIGSSIAQILKIPKINIEIEIILGYLFNSVLLLIPVLFFNFSIIESAGFLLTIYILLIISFYKNIFHSKYYKYDLEKFSVLILFFAIYFSFSWLPIISTVELERVGFLAIWSDYFIHGVTIASLGGTLSLNGNMELAGDSYGLYHYIPFAFPALINSISNISALTLSSIFLLPFGIFIGILGIYSFSYKLGGKYSANLSLLAILLPQTFFEVIQNGYFDFFWLIYASPGTAYSIGIAFAIFTLLLNYDKSNDKKFIYLIFILLIFLFFVRVNIFLLAAPVSILFIINSRYRIDNNKHIKLITIVLLTLLIIGLNGYLDYYSKSNDYLNYILGNLFYRGTGINLNLPIPWVNLVIIFLMTLAILGVYLPIYIISLIGKIRSFGYENSDLLPFLTFTFFILAILFYPPGSNGDISEFKHRHFPLLYIVIIVYSVHYINILIRNNIKHIVIYLILFATIPTSLYFGLSINPATPKYIFIPWAKKYFDQKVDFELIEISRHIANNSIRGDIFAFLGGPNADPALDLNLAIISISGAPSFISRAEVISASSKCNRSVISDRKKILEEIASLSKFAEIEAAMKYSSVRWLIVDTAHIKTWGGFQGRAIFSGKNYILFDFGYLLEKEAQNFISCTKR